MKKIYALMIGEEVIRKSERRDELVHERDEMNNKDAYVCTYIGRVKIVGDQVLRDDNEQPEELVTEEGQS